MLEVHFVDGVFICALLTASMAGGALLIGDLPGWAKPLAGVRLAARIEGSLPAGALPAGVRRALLVATADRY